MGFYTLVFQALGVALTAVSGSGQQPKPRAADPKLETTYDQFVDETTVGTEFTPVSVSSGNDAGRIDFRAAYICSGNQTACGPKALSAGDGAGDVMLVLRARGASWTYQDLPLKFSADRRPVEVPTPVWEGKPASKSGDTLSVEETLSTYVPAQVLVRLSKARSVTGELGSVHFRLSAQTIKALAELVLGIKLYPAPHKPRAWWRKQATRQP
jgi:hypothetical protein